MRCAELVEVTDLKDKHNEEPLAHEYLTNIINIMSKSDIVDKH